MKATFSKPKEKKSKPRLPPPPFLPTVQPRKPKSDTVKRRKKKNWKRELQFIFIHFHGIVSKDHIKANKDSAFSKLGNVVKDWKSKKS